MVSDRRSPAWWQRVALPAMIAAFVLLAWLNRFIQDDAFISFRYAHNLARGLGLVWNPGERIEGYTNFLWTLVMAVPHVAGTNPVVFSFGLGLVLFGISLYLTYRVAALILASPGRGLLAVLLLGTNYTFSAFATSGMETQLQACLFVLAVFVLLHGDAGSGWFTGRLALLSSVLGLAMLTRPDSALLAMVLLPVAFSRTRATKPARALNLVALLLPFFALVGAWLVWKLFYYGNLLPNTFYAKAPTPISLLRGCYYFALFGGSYLFVVLLPLGFSAARRLLSGRAVAPRVLLILTAVWFGYVLSFGGDFMEFRMLVPVLPFLFILIVWALFDIVANRTMRTVLLALVVAGSFLHAVWYGKGLLKRDPESVGQLAGHLTGPDQNWVGIGRALGQAFGPNSDVVIATTAAGAIPYYSGMRTVDMLGLNDPWVARNGRLLRPRAGHRRAATLEYLVQRRVNLVIGHPTLVDSDSAAAAVEPAAFIPGFRDTDDIPDSARIVEIPIDCGYRLVALYLTPSARADSVIAARRWRVRPVRLPTGLRQLP